MRGPQGSALFLLACLIQTQATADINAERIVQQNERAVVIILGEKSGSGAPVQSSGCFVDTSGLILTTAHQVGGVQSLRARLVDGTERALAVVAVDSDCEIALLRSEAAAPHAARIGDATLLKSGAPLVAIATPENLAFSTVTGIVSNTNRTYKGYPAIQTNLPAAPGSSGGPVFDQAGMLVGVIVGKLAETDSVTVVNPINNAYKLLETHGVRIPMTGAGLAHEEADEIIPAKGISDLELQAVKTYNHGVAVTSPAEKIAAYSMAVKLLPGFYEAWFNLAVAYTAAGDLPGALNAYERAAQLKPDAVEVQRNMGRVLLRQQRVEAAAACFERALRVKPDDPSAHNDVGEAYREAQQFDRAEQEFLAALQRDSRYAPARFNLGLTYAAGGRASEAVASFQEYLRLRPDGPDVSLVKEWITKLETGTR